MAEPIGSLRVELSAGWAQLEKSFTKVRKQTKSLGKTLEGLDRPLTKVAKNAGKAFALVGAGAAAAAAGVIALGSRGAQVADVAAAFDALSESAGESADVMLGALREGVKSTMSDFDLMKVANKALGAGLLSTAADAETLAAGARLLAKRTGGDTAQAFETLTTAIASGRTAQLKQLGLFVDSKQAVEDYAAAQGKSISEVNDADRAAALQTATLAALRNELRENAPAAADFGEKIEQVKVELQNAFDALAVLVSELPAMATLLDGLTGLFRNLTREIEGNRSIIVDLITNGIILFARSLVAVVKASQLALDVFDSLRLTWLSLRNIVLQVAKAYGLFAEVQAKVFGDKRHLENVRAAIDEIDRQIQANARNADAVIQGNAEMTDAIQQTRRELAELGRSVNEAANEERKATTTTRELKTEVEGFGTAVETAAEASKAWAKTLKTENALALQLMKDELAEFKQAEDDAREAAEQLADETRTAFEGMKDELADFNAEAKRLQDAKLEGLFVGLSLVAGTFNDELAATAQVIENIGTAFRDAETDAEKFYAIVAGIGQIGGQIGGQLGGLLQGAAGGALAGAMFGPWGAAIGGALGGIASLFGDAGESVNDLRDAFLHAQGGWLALQRELATATTEDLVGQLFDADTVEEFNAAVQRVKDTLDLQGQAQRELQAAIEKYGFTIEQLGPAMQRQELDKQAAQFLKEWRLLTEGGLIPASTVIEKMGPNLLDFVNTSIAAGQAIPAAMKPMIDELIRSGQLVDANGQAFESAEDAGVTFTETLTEGLSRAVDAIERLVAALTGVPAVNIPVNVNVNYRERGRPDDIPGVPDFAHGGVGNFGAGTLAMLHGREAILPLDGAGSGPGSNAILEELRAIRRGQEEQPRAVGRAVRDSMAFGTR